MEEIRKRNEERQRRYAVRVKDLYIIMCSSKLKTKFSLQQTTVKQSVNVIKMLKDFLLVTDVSAIEIFISVKCYYECC